MSIDAINATNTDAFLEEKEEEISERMEDISRVAKQGFQKKPQVGSTDVGIYLCSDEVRPMPKGEWHGTWSAVGEMDVQGKKSATFELKESYKSQEKKMSGELAAGVNEKGKLSGRVKVEGEF